MRSSSHTSPYTELCFFPQNARRLLRERDDIIIHLRDDLRSERVQSQVSSGLTEHVAIQASDYDERGQGDVEPTVEPISSEDRAFATAEALVAHRSGSTSAAGSSSSSSSSKLGTSNEMRMVSADQEQCLARA